MPRTPLPVKIIELFDDQFPDLETVQSQALATITSDLAETIRALLASGVLINQNGRIIPNPQENTEH